MSRITQSKSGGLGQGAKTGIMQAKNRKAFEEQFRVKSLGGDNYLTLHDDETITSIVLDYGTGDDSSMYVYHQVMPLLETDKFSNEIGVVPLNQFLRNTLKKRVRFKEPDVVGVGYDMVSFDSEIWHVGGKIDRFDLANADSWRTEQEDLAKLLMNHAHIANEAAWAEAFMDDTQNASSFTLMTLTANTTWFDANGVGKANSDPIADGRNAVRAIRRAGRVNPAEIAVVIADDVMDVLPRHPKLITAIQGGANQQWPAHIANMGPVFEAWGISPNMVFTPYGLQIDDNPGQDTQTVDDIISGKILFVYGGGSRSFSGRGPRSGCRIVNTAYADFSPEGISMTTRPDPLIPGNIDMEIETCLGFLVTDQNLGRLRRVRDAA